MTFEEFCKQVSDMVLRQHVPVVVASVEATRRASEIVFHWEHVDAVALFGQAAIDRADYESGMVADPRLLAGIIAYVLPDLEDFAREGEPDDIDPQPLALPQRAGTWFILAIRDPHMALDGQNILVHGDPNGAE